MTEWKAYYSVEPFGQERDNWNAAIIASTVANYSGKTRVAKKLDDFMFIHPETKRHRETLKTLAAMAIFAKKNV